MLYKHECLTVQRELRLQTELLHHPRLIRRDCVPLDLRILRILLPARVSISGRNASERVSPTSDYLDLGHAMTITQDDADLRRRCALLCELADVVHDLFWRGLEPLWRSSRIWDGAG